MNLPSELTEGADLRGNEFAWRPDAFPKVLAKAKTMGFGCLGGQFQFRTPTSTCEMYWLNPDPDERTSTESWEVFAPKSCDQTLVRVEAMLRETDFSQEALRWTNAPELASADSNPLQYLCFVAYFIRDKAGG